MLKFAGLTTTTWAALRPARFLWPFDNRRRADLFSDNVALQQTIDETIRGLGFELVELERSAGGLLRVTIDFPWSPDEAVRLITVEDCERATRQLQYVLEVEGVDYHRLEVSTPGIDRPLRHAQDFERFEGELVDVTLKAPIGEAAAIRRAAGECLKRVPLERRIRLLGVKVASLIWTADWLASEHDPVAREALLRPAALTSVKNSDPYTASLF